MAVLLLVAPAMAEVKITCSQGFESNVITVSYDALSEANLPRAFALDITLVDTYDTDNAVITSVTAAKVGESNSSSRGYGIFLGTDGVDINENTGEIIKPPAGRGWGNPAANPADPCALPGIGTKAVTVELASLYKGPQGVGNPNAPAKNGALMTFTVNDKICDVVITLNARRGGIVMEDPDQVVTVNLPGVGATPAFAIECPRDVCGGPPYAAPFGPKDGVIDGWDYSRVSGNWGTSPTDIRADIVCGPPQGPPYAPPIPGSPVVDGWDYSAVSGAWGRNWR